MVRTLLVVQRHADAADVHRDRVQRPHRVVLRIGGHFDELAAREEQRERPVELVLLRLMRVREAGNNL